MADTAKSSGFLKGLKGLVFEDAPEQSTTKSAAPPPPAPVVLQQVTPAVAAAVDPEVRKVLDRDVGEAAKPAYSEFTSLSQSMAAVLTDERVRFQAVLAALASKGHTVEQVLIDIDECNQALDKKEAEAAKAAAQARATRVGAREAEIANVNKRIGELTVAMTDLQAQKEKLEGEVASEVADLQAAEGRFSGTVAAYRAELSALKTKIQTLMNGAR
jgi:predicted  nucleic acid-binding Zn-ribbon protein